MKSSCWEVYYVQCPWHTNAPRIGAHRIHVALKLASPANNTLEIFSHSKRYVIFHWLSSYPLSFHSQESWAQLLDGGKHVIPSDYSCGFSIPLCQQVFPYQPFEDREEFQCFPAKDGNWVGRTCGVLLAPCALNLLSWLTSDCDIGILRNMV